jgi:hypothetical protein
MAGSNFILRNDTNVEGLGKILTRFRVWGTRQTALFLLLLLAGWLNQTLVWWLNQLLVGWLNQTLVGWLNQALVGWLNQPLAGWLNQLLSGFYYLAKRR